MSTVQVPLSQDLVAVVDESDAARTTIALHRYLTGFPLTDHVNGDGLDNRRSNLRDATVGENGRNRRRGVDNTSGFKGVSWHARSRKWQSLIRVNGPQRFLGYYVTADAAALAYDVAARELHGEFATLNFPGPGERAAFTDPALAGRI